MATLTRFEERTPRWLGNAEQADPFRLRIRRMTNGDLREFFARYHALGEKGKAATAADVAELFAPVVQGPVGDLTIDGEKIETLERLIEVACLELVTFRDNLIAELLELVTSVNRLEELRVGESAGRRGGGSTTSPAPSETEPPAKPAGA